MLVGKRERERGREGLNLWEKCIGPHLAFSRIYEARSRSGSYNPGKVGRFAVSKICRALKEMLGVLKFRVLFIFYRWPVGRMPEDLTPESEL